MISGGRVEIVRPRLSPQQLGVHLHCGFFHRFFLTV